MSIMHIAGGIIIGIVIGRLFSIFTLREIKGGKYTYMLVGIIGSIVSDLIFRFLWSNDLVSSFFYKQYVIIFEMIIGSFALCYLVSKLGTRKSVDFE